MRDLCRNLSQKCRGLMRKGGGGIILAGFYGYHIIVRHCLGGFYVI
jgi:hypothetical protein